MEKTKFTNNILDILDGSKANRTCYKLWGGQQPPMSMGDGVKFRVTKSPFVDYVYIKYLAGYASFEVEFAALVGLDYDVIDRIAPVMPKDLMRTISSKVLSFVIDPPKVQAGKA